MLGETLDRWPSNLYDPTRLTDPLQRILDPTVKDLYHTSQIADLRLHCLFKYAVKMSVLENIL